MFVADKRSFCIKTVLRRMHHSNVFICGRMHSGLLQNAKPTVLLSYGRVTMVTKRFGRLEYTSRHTYGQPHIGLILIIHGLPRLPANIFLSHVPS